MKDAKGQVVGRATLSDTPHGVLIRVTFSNVPAGARAFHIHTIGKCDPPEFESAGGHFNPEKTLHGFMEAKGPHAGDLPNVHVLQAGILELELLAEHARLVDGTSQLLDADGAALVLHAALDDYKTDPAGNAGARIACGVITR